MAASPSWNYKEPGAPTLSDEFKAKFFTTGKLVTIKAAGLMSLAHEKGIKSLIPTIIQYPSKENDMTCIVEATIIGYGWSNPEAKVIEVTFSEIGDANMANCGPMVKTAYIRMATTRAISRVLKNYTNIGMLSSEELSGAIETVPVKLINGFQVNAFKKVMSERAISKEQGKQCMIDSCGKVDFRALTEEEADVLISVLRSITVQEPIVPVITKA